MRTVLMLVAGAIGYSGVSAAETPSRGLDRGTDVEFEVLHQGSAGFIDQYKQSAVLVNPQQYAQALAEYTAASPQDVDFEQNRVLFVAQEPGLVGSKVEVESVRANADSVTVKVVLSAPQGCAVPPGIDTPYVFVRVPATRTQEVLVNEEYVRSPC